MELPTTTRPGNSDFVRLAFSEDDEEDISSEDEIRSEDDKFNPFSDDFYGQPFLYHRCPRYPNSIPSYFFKKSGYLDDDDDLFMEFVGDLHLPPAREDEPSPTKLVLVETIWKVARKMTHIWNNKNKDHLRTTIIESAVSLVYFLYPQTEIYRIGRSRELHEELDHLWHLLQLQQDCGFDTVCALVTENNYNLVTEDFIADMIYQPHFTRPRFVNPILPYFPVFAEEDKDQLYMDIAKVVQDLKPPPLEPDEYTHWMMTFLRGDAPDVELDIVTSKIIGDSNKCPIEGQFLDPFYPLLHNLLIKSKEWLKEKLCNVVLPFVKICQPVRQKMSFVMFEIIEVAELRRIAAGNQFIGRSHLIWAFYKLGYMLPLEIRNCIRIDVPDESHPPYHIYMAAAKLARMSGDKYANLLHFIFAVVHSQDIGIDGQGVTELYYHFDSLKKALEKMEDEVEPKHTVTVRPCRAVDAIIQEMRELYENLY